MATVEKFNGYAIVTIKKEPVNSMDLDLWKSLQSALDVVEADGKMKGVIFKSGLKRDIFTAGNDLLELYAPKTTKERYLEFWYVQNTFLAKLLRSKLTTVAAIRGACPAGGCMLAMCCDFRIITSNATMGLNEVAIGLTVPPVWAQVMSTIIGQKEAERMCCYAKIADAVEAKKLGLVDHVVDSNSDSDLMDAAIYIISPAIMVPDQAKAMVKLFFRKSMADVLGDQNRINKEAEVNWPVLASPLVVKALDKVFARLSKSKL